MVVDVKEGSCGMSVPFEAPITPATFQYIAHKVLVRDAINTLMRLNRPLVFELFCDIEQRVAGWRA